MAKGRLGFRDMLQEMITTHAGSISSKIIIGAITYLVLTLSLVVLMFVNPGFPGLSDLVSILIITSASLLGLTTVENVKQTNINGKAKN